MGQYLGQHSSNWSKRLRGNGPWRACAGLTKRVEEKVIGLDPALSAVDGGLPRAQQIAGSTVYC